MVLNEYAVEKILAAAAKTESWASSGKVFISDVHKTMDLKMSMEHFKWLLLDAHQRGLLTLSRADMVAAMPLDKVQESEIRYPLPGGTVEAVFNFIDLLKSKKQGKY